MMVTEYVVDANVLVHAGNEANGYFESALALVIALIEGDDGIALDDTGKSAPNTDASNLYREYTNSISPQSISAQMLIHLLERGRVAFYARPPREQWRKCVALIPRNQNDAIVLGIGAVSADNIIVSNDYSDFPAVVRRKIKKSLAVTLIDSDEVQGRQA